jgi:hypothetical protein
MDKEEPRTNQTQGVDAKYTRIAGSENAHAKRVKTLDAAFGILSTNQPPPSDREVQTWLDEYKTEKYG